MNPNSNCTASTNQLPLAFESPPAPAASKSPGSRPRRLTRTESHRMAILAKLRAEPALNVELVTVSLAYRARISDLRKRGHRIVCRRVPGQSDSGLRVYTLETDHE